jgi:hypothetical protein
LSDNPFNKPLDVKPVWFNLVRRMQSTVATNHGAAILTVHVVMEDDIPKFWFSPTVKFIEPKAKMEEIISFLGGGI